MKTINLKKRKIFSISKREVMISVLSLILATVGIKASDNFFGKKAQEESKNLCASDAVYIPSSAGGFCLDKYEASPGPDCSYSFPESRSQSRINLANLDCKPVSQKGARPWTFVSQKDAMELCARVGKRLPTNQEWMIASLGTPDIDDGWQNDDCQLNSNWKEQPGFSGTSEKCKSSYGAYDMIGNVWEWVEGSVYNGVYKGKKLPKQGFVSLIDDTSIPLETTKNKVNDNYNNDYFWIKNKGLRMMARGGYWKSKAEGGIYSLYIVPPPDFTGSGIGFRCVK